jgi:nickel superoxide dismutase
MRQITLLSIIAFFALTANKSYAHCEIPCGIYGDSVRVILIKEHIRTIEKSINMINKLSEEGNSNQLVRWVMNKEEHCNKIQDIATQYFMFQRVKLSDDSAQKRRNSKMLGLLHKLCVYSMKAKQTTDLKYVGFMNETIDEFSNLYFGE